MLWIVPAWVLSLIAVFLLGYYFRGLKKEIEELRQTVKMKVDKQSEPEKPVSTVIDPYDEVQTAIYERDKLMEKLNP